MHTENIPVRITQTGHTTEVAAFDKLADRVAVVRGPDHKVPPSQQQGAK